MRVLLSLSGDVPERVLDKVIATINSEAPTGTAGIFTNRSCYGKVAHFLRQHWDDNWILYMFGAHYVEHACLYTQSGQKVVDTFSGRLDAAGYSIQDEDIPLLRKIKLSAIRHKVSRFSK